MAVQPEEGNNTLARFENESEANLLQLARITEAAERFEDMCSIMGNLVKKKHEGKKDLEVEERNMLSVAYKNVVGQRRQSWRQLKGAEEEAEKGDIKQYTSQYKAVVEKELQEKCNEVLALLQDHLIDPTPDVDNMTAEQIETQVFYLKMSGDYYRYLAEFDETGDGSIAATAKSAEEKYAVALEMAEKLAPTHPTRLGLALNASVCYYEIMKQPNKACGLAKKAFDEAIQKLDSLSDSTYKDSTLIMQLLRDNLTIWTSESENPTIETNDD